MSDTTTYRCPSCGGALQVSRGQRTAKCPYCGNSVQVDTPPAGLEDLQAEQTALMNNMFQSALDMQQKQAAVARDLIQSTMPTVYRGTVVLPIVIFVVTLLAIACIFGFVWLSFGSAFSMFR